MNPCLPRIFTNKLKVTSMKTIRKGRVALSGIALLFATLFGMHDASASCSLLSNWNNIAVQMQGGTVVVKPTDQVGTMLANFSTIIPVASSNVAPTGNYYEATARCPGGGQAYAVALQGNLVTGAGIPDNVFSTNIPGIGVRMARVVGTANGGSTQYYTTAGSNGIAIANQSFGVVYSNTQFQIQIYKIAAATGSGTLTPGQYSTAYFDGSGSGKPYITSWLTANIISIVTPTCTVDAGSVNQTVTLKKIQSTELKGKGTTAADKPFNIALNCVRGTGIPPTVQLSFDSNSGNYAPGTFPADGVLPQLNTTNGGAKNVGIQVLSQWNGATTPIDLGGNRLNVGPTKDGAYVIPFIARYYQTQNNRVTGGLVSSIVTFTINYS